MAGRPSGAMNRNSKALHTRLMQIYGDDFEPVLKMAENAVRMQEIADATEEGEFDCRKETVTAWEKVAKFVTPQLRSIEVSGNEDAPMRTRITVEYVDSTNSEQV